MAEEDSQGLVTFRITLLGRSQSGKTALASAFVNNFCPFVYTPTHDPVIYYKTVSLAPIIRESDIHSDIGSNIGSEKTAASEAPSEPLKVLVELEDTYGSERSDGVCRYGFKRQSDFFYDMFSTDNDKKRWETEKQRRDEGKRLHTLLGHQPTPQLGVYSTVSAVRMAFVFVFDAHDRESFNEAKRVMSEVEKKIGRRNFAAKPIMLLVANKVDEDDHKPLIVTKILAEASEVARKANIDVEEISAYKLKRVKAMFFNKILRNIQRQDIFWKRTIKKPTVTRGGGAMEAAFAGASAGMARLGRAAVPQAEQTTARSVGSQGTSQTAPPGTNPQDCTMQ